jgi:hypothetical protein
MFILQHVADEVADKVKVGSRRSMKQRLQVLMTTIGDGAKGGSLRAVQKVPFFCGDGPLPTVEWCVPCFRTWRCGLLDKSAICSLSLHLVQAATIRC